MRNLDFCIIRTYNMYVRTSRAMDYSEMTFLYLSFLVSNRPGGALMVRRI